MTPEQTLKSMESYLKNMQYAASHHVAVGITGENAAKPYQDGASLVEVAAVHEFGQGASPQRSFLKIPFEIKQDELFEFIDDRFAKVLKGEDAKKSLGLIGLKAVNISKGAFQTSGYGSWQDIKQSTKNKKGSSQPLVDTGQLRNSITSQVRDD